MRQIVRLFYISLVTIALSSSTGDTKSFPDFHGVTLSGKMVSLPDPAKKKYTFIGCAYSMEAQDALYTWAQPVYDRLIDNPMYPVNTYFVAMTGKIKIMSQDKIKAKMKENLDPELYKYIVVYQDDPRDYIDALGMDDKDLPYFFVIAPDGKIMYSTSGSFDEEKFEKVTDALSE